MSSVTLTLAQMQVRNGVPRTNWTNMQAMTTEAARRGSDAVIFPELWDAGMRFEVAKDVASSLSGGLFAQVAALARQQDIHIFGTQYEKRGTGFHNTLAAISPRSGVMAAYRKIHLFPLDDEDKWLMPGEAPLALDMPWGRTAFAICYDLRFPELFRRYASEGAALVIVPAAWPHPRLEHFRTLLRARAIENQCFVAAVNRVGMEEDGTHYFGHSCVIDPWGEIVVEAGGTEGLFTATIDLDFVREVRQALPALDSRRL